MGDRFKNSETLLGIETCNSEGEHFGARLQKLWNPFRDWNLTLTLPASTPAALQKLWNPFRDWNFKEGGTIKVARSFKNSETLLGIETLRYPMRLHSDRGFKNSETLLGIETTR